MLLKPVKRIGDIKANAAEVLSKIAEDREPRVSTQNGEAKAALRDLARYRQTQETRALLKILTLGRRTWKWAA